VINTIRQLYNWLLSLIRRGKLEREMEEEMRFHLEMQVEQNLEAGMAAKDARYAARRQFGNQPWLKEANREMWSLNSIETLVQDLRYSARMLTKKPGFTLLAVTTLALCIGVNTALFTGFNLLLRPKPIKDPDTVVKLEQRGCSGRTFSYADYLTFRDRTQSFWTLLPSYSAGFY
jgi:hypothetical protein